MSLDEAIRYYSHLADECRRKVDIERNDYMDLRDLTAECEQLADWLNELKVLREKIQKLLKKQEQSCDTCRHGRFGDEACINCRVGFPNHYEAEEKV